MRRYCCACERERALSTILFPCLQELTDKPENKSKATDALGAMVAAVPGERAAAWVTLQDPKKTYNEAHKMNFV